MKRNVCVTLALVLAVLWLAACAPAPAPTTAPVVSAPTSAPAAPTATSAPPAPAFPTKDITFIIPVTPGGGFDTNARILAPFLKKYLPGNPNVVAKNVPGGEWRLGIMEMVKAQPDGHTISIFNIPGNVIGPITGRAEYDLNKVAWIGRITDTTYVMALSPKSPYKTLDDLRKATQVKSGVVGLTSSSALAIIFSAEEMGFKTKLINYDGSQDALLAGNLRLQPFDLQSQVALAGLQLRGDPGGLRLVPVAILLRARHRRLEFGRPPALLLDHAAARQAVGLRRLEIPAQVRELRLQQVGPVAKRLGFTLQRPELLETQVHLGVEPGHLLALLLDHLGARFPVGFRRLEVPLQVRELRL